MPNWGAGLSGAGSGAATGAMFGPWGAAVGGAIGGIAGLFSKKKPAVDPNVLPPDATESIYDINKLFKPQFKAGKKNLAAGTHAFGDAQDFWGTILGGDRDAITQLMAPQISQVGDQYAAARNNVNEFAPRGGGKSAILAELPTKQAHDIGSFFLNARPAAADAMERLGAERNAAGMGEFAGAQSGPMGILQSILSHSLGQQQLDLQKRGQTLGIAGGLGETLGNVLSMWLNKKKTTNTDDSDGGGGLGGLFHSPSAGGGIEGIDF